MSRSCSWPTPTRTTWPRSTSRSRARARRSGSSRWAGIPTSVRASRDGKTLWVANGKGGTSKANRDGPLPGLRGGRRGRTRAVHRRPASRARSRRSPCPRRSRWPAYSQTVYECSPLKKDDPASRDRPRRSRRTTPSPARSATPSPITHCIYIIKENRTYDQVFGDMPEGNGDPSHLPVPRGGHAEPSRPGARVRSAGQLLRREPRSRPTATSGRWGPTPPTSSSAPGRSATAATSACHTRPRGASRSPGRPADTSGTAPRPKGVTYRSYGEFVEQRQDARRPRRRPRSRGPEGPLRPQVPRLRPRLPRPEARRPLPRGACRVRGQGARCPA